MLQGVIFDIDGALVDSNAAFLGMLLFTAHSHQDPSPIRADYSHGIGRRFENLHQVGRRRRYEMLIMDFESGRVDTGGARLPLYKYLLS